LVLLDWPEQAMPYSSSASVTAEITTSPTKHWLNRALTCGG
jgi:hypothetical protein